MAALRRREHGGAYKIERVESLEFISRAFTPPIVFDGVSDAADAVNVFRIKAVGKINNHRMKERLPCLSQSAALLAMPRSCRSGTRRDLLGKNL